MRKIILLIFGLFCAAGMDAAAQDVITRRNGEDIKAVIVEVTDDAIKYKRENLPDGPLFTISKADVLMVTYSDGSRDVFADYMPGGQAPAPAAYAEAPANLRPGMKYRELLQYYDYRNYRNFMGYERFSPAVAGLCSFILPGLGQVISGEPGRGLGYLGGSAACYVTFVLSCVSASGTGAPYYATTLALVSGIGFFVVNISSIVDAVRVAKVKNMYYSDLDNLAFNVDLTPYVDLAYAGAAGVQPVAGLSLRLSF